MEVTQKEDHITHAVIGASETIEMGMSNDASLMHIMSATLYTHRELAAVREPICNGWDAHITSGLTDKPMEISVLARSIVIKDFGTGIPHDKIGTIYGVYGNSTKREDSDVTGGFGLGSKAPFAYVDLFEVVSCHEGTKTIYRVSKSSMEKGGKPAINKVVAMPTEETGITVSFALKEGDAPKFLKLVQEVVTLGGIKANINAGENNVETLPLEESHTGYLITGFRGTVSSSINLRYGNVVYPVPRTDEYGKEWDVVHQAMRQLWGGANIIFMAPPNTVSIAPSRENLILTEGTLATIQKALGQFDPNIMQSGEKNLREIVQAKGNESLASEPIPDTWTNLTKRAHANLDAIRGPISRGGQYSFTLKGAHLQYLISCQDSEVDQRKVLTKRLKRLVRERIGDTVLAKEIVRYMVKETKGEHNRGYRTHRNKSVIIPLRKRVIYPLLKAIAANPKVSKERLMVVDSIGWAGPNFVQTKQLKIRTFEQACSFLYKKVVIGTTNSAMQEYIKQVHRNNALSNGGYDSGDDTGWFTYRATHHAANLAAVIEMFESLGYEVHNLVVPKAKKIAEVDPNAPPKPKRVVKKRTGYLSLNQSYDKVDKTFVLTTARKHTDGECVNPLAWVVLHARNRRPGSKRINWFREESSQVIMKLLGDRIAVVTDVQSEVLLAKGVPSLKSFIGKYVDEKLANSPDYARYLAFAKVAQDGVDRHGGVTEKIYLVMRNMTQHKDLMDKLGLRLSMDPETALMVRFLEEEDMDDDCTLSQELREKVKPNKKFTKVYEMLKTTPWAKFVDFNLLQKELQKADETSESLQLAKHIVAEMLPFKKLHSKKVAT